MDILLGLCCCYASNYFRSHHQFTLNKTHSQNNSTFCTLLSEDQLFNISSKVHTVYRFGNEKCCNRLCAMVIYQNISVNVSALQSIFNECTRVS